MARKGKGPPREAGVIASEVRQLEAQLGAKEYVRRVIEAECVQLAQKLLDLNAEHAASVAAAGKG